MGIRRIVLLLKTPNGLSQHSDTQSTVCTDKKAPLLSHKRQRAAANPGGPCSDHPRRTNYSWYSCYAEVLKVLC
eukprot:4586184-Amphidinium_carterae.1